MEEKILKVVKKAIKTHKKIYIVGGAVRDWLMKRQIYDIDIICEGEIDSAINKDINFFIIDKENRVYRAFIDGYQVDVSSVHGNGIVDDLKRRDFTVNSIAYDVTDKRFIDPLGGINDLKKGILKAVNTKNLLDDPLRMIRGVRLWLYYPFYIDKETEDFIKQNSSKIKESASERIKDELIKIVSHPLSYKALYKLLNLNLLFAIFHELSTSKRFPHDKFFGNNLLTHLIYTYRFTEVIINHLNSIFHEFSDDISKIMESKLEANLKKKHALKLAALFHDIAKPKTFVIRGNEYTFWGHDKLGSEICQKMMNRLKFSNKTIKFTGLLISNHMRLHLLARSREITDKAKGRFFRQLGKDGVCTIILSLADSMSSSYMIGFFYLLYYARNLLDFYFNKFLKKENLQKPLLSGFEIMDILKIKPGITVGKLKEALLEAQLDGKVKNKKEAEKFIREVFRNGI